MRGIRAVEKALGIFTRIRKQLEDAIFRCVDDLEELDKQASVIRCDILEINEAKIRAERVLEALTKITEV